MNVGMLASRGEEGEEGRPRAAGSRQGTNAGQTYLIMN